MKKRLFILMLLGAAVLFIFPEKEMEMKQNLDTAVIGGGCFWCIEAVYEKIDGIVSAESGYAGGSGKNPAYEEVSSGNTGHAEVVKIVFDKNIITYEEILKLFFKAHDPTTLNRQGADVGSQYRSIILYMDKEQKNTAVEYIKKLEKDGFYDKPIVTEVKKLKEFYIAEDYHQDYYEKNPFAGYCTIVIRPKLRKLGLE